MKQSRFIDPVTLAKINNLMLVAKVVVEGFISGIHRSPFHGFSVEFSERREYAEGDEIKHIDWKTFAKFDKYYVKEYSAETNLKCHIVLDASASMGYKSGGISKLEYASYLAAALTYLMLSQQDSVGLLIFDDKIRNFIPPRGGRRHLKNILSVLENTVPEKETNVGKVLHDLAENIRKRGLIILISDFFDSPDNIIRGLKHFLHKKHEVIAFHIVDVLEKEFNFYDMVEFIDMEKGEKVLVDTDDIRKEYRNNFSKFLGGVKAGCLLNNITYELMETNMPLDSAMVSFLARRERLM